MCDQIYLPRAKIARLCDLKQIYHQQDLMFYKPQDWKLNCVWKYAVDLTQIKR